MARKKAQQGDLASAEISAKFLEQLTQDFLHNGGEADVNKTAILMPDCIDAGTESGHCGIGPARNK